MERLAGRLPRGFGFEWTGQSLQEKLSGSQAPFLLGLSALVVFLLLAALYESWTIPLAVLMTVPLGITGAVIAATMRGLPNDVYFTVGLITIIGLAAKDAILIIEFAKDLRAEGKSLIEATVEACSLALPPDPDDRPCLRLRRAADGDRDRRRRRQPAGARHQRDGRHDRGRDPGAVDGAGVLRRGAASLAGDREKVEEKRRRTARPPTPAADIVMPARSWAIESRQMWLATQPRTGMALTVVTAARRYAPAASNLHQFGVHELVAAHRHRRSSAHRHGHPCRR